MVDVHTISNGAKVVKFQSEWDAAALALVDESVGSDQCISCPNPRVAIGLNDREKQTIAARDQFNALRPFRDVGLGANAPHVFKVGYQLQMVGVHASAVSAEVVKFHPVWNGTIPLLPEPDVAHVEFLSPSYAGVSVASRSTNKPAFCERVFDWFAVHPVTVDVLAWLSRDVPQSALPGNWRLSTTSAPAQSGRVANLADLQLAVAPQKSVVATLNSAVAAIAGYRCARAASTLANSGRVRPARVVGTQHLASATWRSAAQSGIVAFQKSWFAGQMRAASALAKRARIGVGHLISLKDRWSRLAGVHALRQPFQYIVKEVRV